MELGGKMDGEFDVNKVYYKTVTKKKAVEILRQCSDKKLKISFWPRSKTNADMIIESIRGNKKC